MGRAEVVVDTASSVEEWAKCLRELAVDRVIVGMTAGEEGVFNTTHDGGAVDAALSCAVARDVG